MSMGAMAGTTLDNVKKKGFVQCGISDGLPGFSYTDPKGNFHGFDVDVCRAVAVQPSFPLDRREGKRISRRVPEQSGNGAGCRLETIVYNIK